MSFASNAMKYFATRKDDAKTSDTREFFIIENQTAEFAANNVNDDPANLDGRNTIHIIGVIIGLLPTESSDRLPILQILFPMHKWVNFLQTDF